MYISTAIKSSETKGLESSDPKYKILPIKHADDYVGYLKTWLTDLLELLIASPKISSPRYCSIDLT